MNPEKYKICKTCGNRNHPRSGQCPWCGARLKRPLDWISRIALLIIALLLISLFVYSRLSKAPTPHQQDFTPENLEALTK